MIVPRTATALVQEPEPQSTSQTARARDGTWRHGPSRPVADFGSERAYVLLGDPGSGKTTTFKEEAGALPDENHYVTARKFLRADLDQHQEWRTKTLFIDGLDEVRAGRSNHWKPLDDILERLEQLDYPRVRISCRFADWYPSDQLELVGGEYSDFQILRLDPLTRTDADRIMEAESRNTDTLSTIAYESGIDHFYSNPQLLKLLIAGRPGTEAARCKATLFENACRTMAREFNTVHQEAALVPATCPDNIVSAASQLCAMLLLTGKTHISLYRSEVGDPDDCLPLDDVQGEQDVLRLSLRTKLFTGPAPRQMTADQMTPVHSLVAEYLAGRYLADQIDDPKGIPAARVLALMRGPDNEVVPTLRGVAAWLATFVPSVRRCLIKSDPWGILAYADTHCFYDAEKELLLTHLAAQGETAMHFWDLPDVAVAGLVGPDTISTVRRYITIPDPSDKTENAMALVFRGVAARTGM